MICVLIRKREATQMEGGHVKMEAEIGVMCPQAEGSQGLPARTKC